MVRQDNASDLADPFRSIASGGDLHRYFTEAFAAHNSFNRQVAVIEGLDGKTCKVKRRWKRPPSCQGRPAS